MKVWMRSVLLPIIKLVHNFICVATENWATRI